MRHAALYQILDFANRSGDHNLSYPTMMTLINDESSAVRNNAMLGDSVFFHVQNIRTLARSLARVSPQRSSPEVIWDDDYKNFQFSGCKASLASFCTFLCDLWTLHIQNALCKSNDTRAPVFRQLFLFFPSNHLISIMTSLTVLVSLCS